MTPDELEALVLGASDSWQLQRALEPLDEKQRAKLSSSAQKLFNQLEKSKANESASERLRTLLSGRTGDLWNYWNSEENRRAKLALYGVCPVSVLKKSQLYIWPDERAVFDRIIRDRRPEWLDDWIADDLEQERSKLDFDILRGWIRDGLCRKPTVDGYYRMFAWHLMRTGFYQRGEKVPPITVQIAADPDLLADIDGLFRVENIAFNTNSWLTRGAADEYETWPDALVKLAARGSVDREHLLRLALDGLQLDLKQNQLSGFHGFYKRMAPTAAERLRHQQGYIDLLCHPVGHVVKFAIEMLTAIEKEDGLETGRVVREIQGTVARAGKGNAVAALRLLKRILARPKADKAQVLSAACEGLRHADASVQGLALDILEAYSAQLGAETASSLRDADAFVAASNRARLAKLLVCAGLGPADQNRPDTAEPKSEFTSSHQMRPEYSAISGDINDQRVLSAEDALAPIETLDDLIETVLHAVEVVDSPDEVERIVDAISRLADDRPRDFDERVAPLLHRVKAGRTGANGLVIAHAGIGLAMLDLLYTWLTGQLHRTPDRASDEYYAFEDAFRPVGEHLRVVAERVARRQAFPPLSTPTHKGGWIDPLVWVERLEHVRGDLAQTMDFRLSLLRLAPDHRSEALALAQTLDERWRRVALFALGGDERPGRADRRDYAAWICAARCRAPSKDWSDELAALGLPDSWPDALHPARYEWRAEVRTRENRWQTWRQSEFNVRVSCENFAASSTPAGTSISKFMRAISGQLAVDWMALPTVALNRRMEARRSWAGELSTTWVAQWLAYVWPQNAASAHMKGATKLAQRMDEDSSNWTPGHGFFRALFQRNRPWGEPGHIVLCLGLAGKDADAKGLAVDALIEGIDGRLFDPSLFADTIAGFAATDWIKFSRLGDSLMSAVAVSELHAAAVGDALLRCVPRLNLQARGVFRLLEVLVEAQALAEQPLREDAQAALRMVAGSGKAAKIAKQLLAA